MRIKCKDCGSATDVGGLKKEWKNIQGHKVLLTYFKCEKCDKYHIVQLDDEQTIMCLEEVKKKLKSVAECNMKGKTPRKRLTNGLKKKNKELAKLRKFLVDCYSSDKYMTIINGVILPVVVEMQEQIEGD